MIRISRQADYGILLLGFFAKAPGGKTLSARELAETTHLGLPMVSKVLKLLTRSGLLLSHRGVHGGYSLVRRPEQITIGQIIEALDGPIAVTDCSPEAVDTSCAQEPVCPVSSSWRLLNDAIRVALDRVTLAEMTCPVANPLGSFAAPGAHQP